MFKILGVINTQKINNKIPEILLFVLVTFYSIAFSALFVFRFHFFALHTDTGSYEQSIWTTIHGNILQSSLAVSVYPFNSVIGGGSQILETIAPFIFSTSHINIIILLITPLYALFPYTETLLIMASVVLASGAIPVYCIAKKELKNKKLSLVFSLSYLLYPALQGANVADFNYLVFAVPLLLSAFYFYRTENWKLYWIFIALSLTVREEVSLFLLLLGILQFAFHKKRKIGLSTMIVGLSVFLILFGILELLPIQLFGGNFSIIGQGNGIMGIFHTLATNPKVIYDHIVTSKDGIYFFEIFSHTAFLTFLSPTSFIISIPEILKNILANPDSFRIMWNHYQLLIIPGVFISTIFSIKKILDRYDSRRNLVIFSIGAVLLLSALISNSTFSPAPLKEADISLEDNHVVLKKRYVIWEFLNFDCCSDYTDNNRMYQSYSEQIKSVNKAISMIPNNVSVSTQDNFDSHLSRRQSLYLFPLYYDKVDYVLVMNKTQGMFDTGYVPQEMQEKYISLLKNDQKHKIILQENGLLLFKKITQSNLHQITYRNESKIFQ